MGLFDNLFDDIEEETINEFVLLDEGNVLKKQKSDLSAVIEVRPDDSRFKNAPYFKVSKENDGWNDSDKNDRMRISFLEPKYEDHPNYPGNWRLWTKEKKKLIKDLQKPYKNTGHTVWEELKKQAVEAGANKSLLAAEMPDYTKL